MPEPVKFGTRDVNVMYDKYDVYNKDHVVITQSLKSTEKMSEVDFFRKDEQRHKLIFSEEYDELSYKEIFKSVFGRMYEMVRTFTNKRAKKKTELMNQNETSTLRKKTT